ncbi:MAG: SPOR domain-containing protein [Polyangia bacterium]
MRDLQHWKDKVELSLDGRQLFFLFFGGAVAACMLFALGIMTGRRLEARAIAMDTPSVEDPLAQLDQLGDLEDEDLTYHRALTRDAHKADKVVKPGTASAAVSPSVALAQAPKPIAPKPTVKLPTLPETTIEAAHATAMKSDKEGGVATNHFTLQLSAFSAKRDADDFMRRVQAAGYHAFIVSSDLPGKGVLYRVRVGDYGTKDAALADKGAVEKKLRVAAYLAKI